MAACVISPLVAIFVWPPELHFFIFFTHIIKLIINYYYLINENLIYLTLILSLRTLRHTCMIFVPSLRLGVILPVFSSILLYSIVRPLIRRGIIDLYYLTAVYFDLNSTKTS